MEDEIDDMPTFKCVLLGDVGTGKTTFVKFYLNNYFEKNYKATCGVDSHTVMLHTNCGPIRFVVWDTSGEPKYSELRELYYTGNHCGIIMFDVTSKESYEHVSQWCRELANVCPDIPVVLCGNKVDKEDREVKANNVKLREKMLFTYIETSVKLNYNIEKPFLLLAGMLMKTCNINLVPTPAAWQTEIPRNRQILQQMEELEMAQDVELPDEDNF